MRSPLPRKTNVLGILISATDYSEVTRCVVEAALLPAPLTVAVCPVHSVVEGYRDPAFGAVLNHMDLAVPDGQPVRWTMRWTKQADLADRVYGPTLMLRLLVAASEHQLPVFFYGSRDTTLASLRERLLERVPGLRIAGMQPGLYREASAHEQAENARQVRESGARIVFSALGCPRQEWWMFHQREAIGVPLIGVGAAFDFHAGIVPQAPGWMQKRGLEWAFRLSQEPDRLWRRYASTNPAFVLGAAQQIGGLRTFEPVTDVSESRRRECPI